jgi:hypothetical protein
MTAPLCWLSKDEKYMPSDIASQISYLEPKVKGVPVEGAPRQLNLDNLNELNKLGADGKDVWLTSHVGIQNYPTWFNGVTPNKETRETKRAHSCAIITVDKGNAEVDAFYFYFFAYNEGNTVLWMQFGNHVGDWEHNMIRFKEGYPQAIFFSQHSRSQVFSYQAVEKEGDRPICYVAKGSHAVFATPG